MIFKKIIYSHYFLVIVLSLILGGLYFIPLSRYQQMILFLIGSFYYIIWGIGHHTIEQRKDKHIFSEYILLGLIGITLTLIVFLPYL